MNWKQFEDTLELPDLNLPNLAAGRDPDKRTSPMASLEPVAQNLTPKAAWGAYTNADYTVFSYNGPGMAVGQPQARRHAANGDDQED